MKASELKISNWVHNSIENIDFQIECFLGSEWCTNICEYDYQEFDSKIEDLKPIPLTEEWLLKFGFEKKPDIDNVTYYTTVFEKDGISLLFFMGKFDDCSIDGDLEIDLSSVHNLQNLWMCLKKEELTIKE